MPQVLDVLETSAHIPGEFRFAVSRTRYRDVFLPSSSDVPQCLLLIQSLHPEGEGLKGTRLDVPFLPGESMKMSTNPTQYPK